MKNRVLNSILDVCLIAFFYQFSCDQNKGIDIKSSQASTSENDTLAFNNSFKQLTNCDGLKNYLKSYKTNFPDEKEITLSFALLNLNDVSI